MIWAACCLAYFGLLRVSEFTTSSPDCFDPSTDLLLSDVALDNRASPTFIQIILKQSKGDQFRKGTKIYLGKTTHAVCPVHALVQYLAMRGGTPGPLFLFPNNKLLTRRSFSAALNEALKELRMDPRHFNTHSFRIGAATSAKRGVSVTHTLKPLAGGEVMLTLNTFDYHHGIWLDCQSLLHLPNRRSKAGCIWQTHIYFTNTYLLN